MAQLYNYKGKSGEVEPGQIKRLKKTNLEVCIAESTTVSSHYWLNQEGVEALVCFIGPFVYTFILSTASSF